MDKVPSPDGQAVEAAQDTEYTASDLPVATFVSKPAPKPSGEAWLAENAAAIEQRNRYVRIHGMPLDHLRDD